MIPITEKIIYTKIILFLFLFNLVFDINSKQTIKNQTNMVINLSFQFNREPLNFIIKEREIYYSQRKFGGGILIRCIPPPDNLIKAVAMSRNRINLNLINMFKFTEEEIKEYNEAKDENALAELIIRDAKSKGCIYVPVSEVNNENKQNETTEVKEEMKEDKIEVKTEDAAK